MVIKTAERETKGPRIDLGIYQPPIRDFMLISQQKQRPIYRQDGSYQRLKDSVSCARIQAKEIETTRIDKWGMSTG